MLQDDAAFSRFYVLLNAINLLSGKTAQWLHESALLFLNEKLKGPYQTLKEMYGPVHRGIVTGLDEAFIVDETTKDRLIKEDPRSADILKPYVEKEDLDKMDDRLPVALADLHSRKPVRHRKLSGDQKPFDAIQKPARRKTRYPEMV